MSSLPHPFAHHPDAISLLADLHALSLQQENQGPVSQRDSHFPKSKADDTLFEDQLVALDEDKAQAMYTILRATGATRIVEAGTSYGVSLIYLTAAVLDNLHSQSKTKHPPLLIGTDYEHSKVQKALAHISKAFPDSPTRSFLHILEGDLLATLPAADIPDSSIDALLLDIWAPVTLPTLQLLKPKFKKGATIFIDNTISSAERYKDLLGYVRNPQNGFISSTLPMQGGFDIVVYNGVRD